MSAHGGQPTGQVKNKFERTKDHAQGRTTHRIVTVHFKSKNQWHMADNAQGGTAQGCKQKAKEQVRAQTSGATHRPATTEDKEKKGQSEEQERKEKPLCKFVS